VARAPLFLLALLLRRPRGRLWCRVPAARLRPLCVQSRGFPARAAAGAGAGRPRTAWRGQRPSRRAPERRGPACARPVCGARRGWRGGRALAGRPGRLRPAGEGAGAPQARPQVPFAVVQEHEAVLRQQRKHLLVAQALLEGLQRQVCGEAQGEWGTQKGQRSRLPSMCGLGVLEVGEEEREAVRCGTQMGIGVCVHFLR
jgi:hypothetical protein